MTAAVPTAAVPTAGTTASYREHRAEEQRAVPVQFEHSIKAMGFVAHGGLLIDACIGAASELEHPRTDPHADGRI